MAYLELSDNLLSHILFGINSNDLAKSAGQDRRQKISKMYLPSHHHLGGSMHDLADGSAISCTELFQNNEVLTPQVKLELETNLQCIGPVAV